MSTPSSRVPWTICIGPPGSRSRRWSAKHPATDAIKREHFKASSHTSICPWKGTAHYYDVVVGDKTNANAAWYYPDPKPEAKEIKGRVAFWKGVEVNVS